MNIAFDLDGTLTDYVEFMVSKQHEFYEKTGIKYQIDFTYTEIGRFKSEEDFYKFWDIYTYEYIYSKLKPEYVEFLKKLIKDGNKVYIITARESFWMTNNDGFDMAKETRKSLDEQGLQSVELVCTFGKSKIPYLKNLNIDYIIEDKGFDTSDVPGCKLLLIDKLYNRSHVCQFRVEDIRDIRMILSEHR